MKIKSLSLAIALLCFAAFGATAGAQDRTPHHAAMHAEHWVNHHVSAPHRKHRRKPRRRPDKSVHHAAMHAEHWIDHHVSAPHKHP